MHDTLPRIFKSIRQIKALFSNRRHSQCDQTRVPDPICLVVIKDGEDLASPQSIDTTQVAHIWAIEKDLLRTEQHFTIQVTAIFLQEMPGNFA